MGKKIKTKTDGELTVFMIFSANQTVNGFRVIRAEEKEDPAGRTVLMEHAKTGARLFWLDNNMENMVFSIAFRTLPEDSTGVYHILEHSVLCGSEHYPMKEPFVELLKSSMNTFLNAMTFPDMTLFPVSSRNPRDLMNLTNVYLDAVFLPKVLKDRKRFCQEGWHIGFDEEGNPEYRGVVFNEMKGAMSETETMIEREVCGMLFRDNYNGFNSGGDPEVIPDLTWEQFKKQYEKCYHPSNAWVYLDGAVPMEEMLPLLDTYFSAYSKRENNPEFVFQEPKGSEKTIYYELGPEEEPEDKGYLTLARITGTWKNRSENLARGIICDVLTGSNESPLKRAALTQGLAKDLNLTVDDTGLQSWVAMYADHVTDGKENEILNLLAKTGEEIRRNGLDRDAVEASLNRAVYHLRDEEEPQGIGRCIRCMGTWLYGGEPEEALETGSMIRDLKHYFNNGTFDHLAADMLLNRENTVVLHAIPSRTLGEERRIREKEKVKKALENMAPEEKEKTAGFTEELKNWQCSPDREEDLATLPVLKREDADIEPKWIETETVILHGVPVMIHRIPSNGVVHLRAYFSLTDLTLEELTKATLFAGMLGRLPTRKYDALRLQQEIKRCTGSLGFSVSCRSKAGESDACTPFLVAFASALEENAERAQELLAEVMGNTLIEGQEERIIEMMMQNEIGARQRIVSAGHLVAIKRCLSAYSADGAVKNAMDGERAIRYIHAFSINPEKETEGFVQTARKLLSESLCTSRMTLSVTSGNDFLPHMLTRAFPAGTPAPQKTTYKESICSATGYRIPARIGFAAKGFRLDRCGMEFSGSMWLAASLLSLGYLWNKVRVQGGAYGAGFQIDRAGNICSYSFRDPTPARTLTVNSGASAFLREFAKTGENLDRYIISALNELNPLLSPRDKGALADARMLNSYTREESERIRKEVLCTTPEQLVSCVEWLDRFASEGNVCVVANEEALQQCEGLEILDL
jgi:hypothetical protein